MLRKGGQMAPLGRVPHPPSLRWGARLSRGAFAWGLCAGACAGAFAWGLRAGPSLPPIGGAAFGRLGGLRPHCLLRAGWRPCGGCAGRSGRAAEGGPDGPPRAGPAPAQPEMGSAAEPRGLCAGACVGPLCGGLCGALRVGLCVGACAGPSLPPIGGAAFGRSGGLRPHCSLSAGWRPCRSCCASAALAAHCGPCCASAALAAHCGTWGAGGCGEGGGLAADGGFEECVGAEVGGPAGEEGGGEFGQGGGEGAG